MPVRLIGCFLMMGVALAACSAVENDEPAPADPEAPAAFSHRVHHAQGDISCRVCHPGAWTEVKAGLPPLDTCIGCHEELETLAETVGGPKGKALIAELESRAETGEPPWGPERKRETDFSHATHAPDVTLQTRAGESVRLRCGDCHRHVAHSDTIPERITPPKEVCLDCHD